MVEYKTQGRVSISVLFVSQVMTQRSMPQSLTLVVTGPNANSVGSVPSKIILTTNVLSDVLESAIGKA